MLKKLITAGALPKGTARKALAGWTLFLLALCFIPGRDIPDIDVPMADKWVHFVLFAVFAFLWPFAFPARRRWVGLLLAFAAAAIFGWLVEELQGLLAFLGRSRSVKDILADAIGGLLGAVIYYLLSLRATGAEKKKSNLTA